MTILMVAAVTAVSLPFLRRSSLASGASANIYRAQLIELEREEAAGLIGAEEARHARTEVQRRLISTSGDPLAMEDSSMTLTDRTAFIAVAGLLAIGSAVVYASTGSPGVASSPHQTVLAANASADAAGQMAVGSVDQMITQLENRLKTQPEDVEGWRMLGWSHFRTDNYSAAVTAYARAVALTPDDGETQSAYGEALARASGGMVTADAEKALRAALKADPADSRARFLLGLKKQQDGSPKAALEDWLAMLATAPADAPWFDEVRGRVVELSQSAGIDVSSRLPPARATATTTARPDGPSMSQVSEAAAMTPEARQAMIDGMVARLDVRLKQNPADLDGWLRLVRARRVLGQNDLAAKAVADGSAAFSGDKAAVGKLQAAMSEPLDLQNN